MSSSSDLSIYKIEPLRGSDNYPVWKVRMKHILTDLGHFSSHVSGPNAKPPTDPAQLTAWNTADAKALSTIVLRVADNVLVYVENKDKAKDAWDALAALYEPKGPIGITIARRKFHRTVCAEDVEIEEHIRSMRSLQAELERLGRKVPDDEFSYTLLESLPESWDTFVSAIDESVTADSNKLIARILSEDLRRKARHPTEDASTALPASDKSHETCFNCGKPGHFAKDCWKNRRDGQPNRNNQSKQSRGHRRGRNSNNYRSRANIASIDDDDDFAFLTREPTLTSTLNTDDWLLDSGCSRAIVRNKANFSTYVETPGHKIIGIGDAAGIGRGNVPLSFALGKSSRACIIREAIHCPTAPFNLISVGRLTDAGYRAIFKDDMVEIRSPQGTLLAIGDKISRLYKLRATPRSASTGENTHAFPARTWDEWHRALGHLNHAAVRRLKTKNMVKGMDVDIRTPPHQCEACIQGKAHVFPFPKESERKYDEIGDMTYSDLWGKARVPGRQGHYYHSSSVR